MALQVTLTKTPDKIGPSRISKTVYTFDAQGGTLGRSASNSWVLPDPDRFLSSCHCEILFADNQFHIVDLSTNGTFVNGSPQPLGKGSKAPLADGDTFEIGDYQFCVKLITDQDNSGSPFGSAVSSAPDFDRLSVGSSPFADAFAASAPAADVSLSPESESTDPLLALDKLKRRTEPDPGLDGILGEFSSQPGPDLYAGMGQVDQSPAMDQAVSWPSSSRQDLIPDDWEDDLLGSGSSSEPGPLPLQQRTVAPAPLTQKPTPVRNLAFEPQPQSGPEVGETQEPPFAYPDPATPEPRTATRSPLQPGTAPRDSSVLREADHRFIAAMGLDASALSEEQIDAITEMAGKMMREIVEGMMQVLRSRTSIKNEFRMNVTTIEPFENNPLKFSVGVDEALENMFIKKSKAYKDPLNAFRESFQEIGEHQLAMIAGIRIGFEKMMRRFDPAVLQELFARQGKNSPLPGMQRAKNWASYCDYYQGFADNMESSFQNLFGSDFVQAYEDQLRRIAASRKK